MIGHENHENTLDRFSKVEIKCISTALLQIPVTSMPTLQYPLFHVTLPRDHVTCLCDDQLRQCGGLKKLFRSYKMYPVRG